ncbi:MAG: hypothetical protein MN733_09930 [Nitrososphaera sp.]|nr:hypothetical protein [Nitrososphaera sp.]
MEFRKHSESVSRQQEGARKLRNLTSRDLYAVQFPLSILLFNRQRVHDGLPPISINSDNCTPEEKTLQKKAFYEWTGTDTNNMHNGGSEFFREFVKKHPEIEIDVSNQTDVGTLFELMFPDHTIHTKDTSIGAPEGVGMS